MAQSTATATTLFEKLGGATTIQAVTEAFYIRVLADDQLKGFFKGVDMDTQTRSQINFLTMAFGGPNEYTGQSMEDAHEGMGITEHHFNLVAGHLVDTLKAAGVPDAEITEVVALVGPLKNAIVTV